MRKGSTSVGACEVQCWRSLLGNQIPVTLHLQSATLSTSSLIRNTRPRGPYKDNLQGYLAHEKTPPPLGPSQGPRDRPTVGS